MTSPIERATASLGESCPFGLDWPTPDHPLTAAEISDTIDRYPSGIESCNECADDRADPSRDLTMHQYIWVWPIKALISNDGHCVRGAGHKPTDYGQFRKCYGYFASRKIRKAISRWRTAVGQPGRPGHYSRSRAMIDLAWREFTDEVAKALRIPAMLDWLSAKLERWLK